MNESFQSIINDAPRIISAMETLTESTGSLRVAASEFTQNLNSSDARIKAFVAENTEKIESLRGTIDDSRTLLKNRVEATHTGMNDLNSRITEMKDEVVSDLSETTESMDMFIELLESGKGSVEGANEEAQNALDAFYEMMGQGGSEMGEVVEQTSVNLDLLASGIEEALSNSAEQIANLTTNVEEVANQTESNLSDLVENSLGTAAETLVTSLDGISGELAQNVSDIFQKAQDDFLDGIKGKVDDVVEQTSDSIETKVRQVILAEADRSGIERALMEPAVDALTDVMDPLVDALEYIKDLASSVGISI
ncbi:MAG: hypothetical protein P1U89_21185 [Verrucomicrobiales bacterium]|nr:hypothetical protein [Verrucomicrobiales bacterium]